MDKKKVLLVDDEKTVLRALERVLAAKPDCDMDITSLSDSSKVEDLLDAGEEFDLLITDLRMNPLNGLEVIDIVQGKQPKTKIVVVSAYLNEDAVNEIQQRGCSAYVRKPFKMDEVFSAVDVAIG